MCGRFSLGVTSASDLARMLEADLLPEDEALYRPRYNVAPTNRHWIVREEGERRLLVPATWGLTTPTGHFVINARSESAAFKFRDAWKGRRCVVPTDGFFEWKGPPKDRRPIWFHPPDGGLLLLAGIFDDSKSDDRPRFVILTTAANERVAEVHDRMPAVIPADRLGRWLQEPERLEPAPVDLLEPTPVSPRLNSPANDDPSLLEPYREPGGSPGQLRLL
ncbi:SOS response-associated peptidase [Vulgatibacter incomptus]|uniref:Abasic site processing protein n=1 Tax=Vulgatibacter incomptus TaxID=1391653 RepID=A0A0K1PDZ4_9BACT|nr:SOS response-associated peptidase [Vulgatibacter incomptus]AKU91646.1 hypothetical protein AKJ08_2033 [Vulgatibacter incomptus]